MSFLLYVMGVFYILLGWALLFTSEECVAAAVFCLAGVTALGFGVVSDAICDGLPLKNLHLERKRGSATTDKDGGKKG